MAKQKLIDFKQEEVKQDKIFIVYLELIFFNVIGRIKFK